jgi:hypothetical protein
MASENLKKFVDRDDKFSSIMNKVMLMNESVKLSIRTVY